MAGMKESISTRESLHVDGVAQGLHPPVVPLNSRPEPRRVDHTYRDYSRYLCFAENLEGHKSGRKAHKANFPAKLHLILSTPEYSHIISWMPHGRAWKIHDKELLISEVTPKFFAQSKFESFTRQLNGWGFKRLYQSGNDFNAYYHECFLRGLPGLTSLLKRVPKNKGKLIPNMEGEPNFYRIDEQFPLPPPMMPCQNHLQYPPTEREADSSSGVSQEHLLDCHASPNKFFSAYGPPPPFFAAPYSPQVGVSYSHYPPQPLMGGYSHYPPQSQMVGYSHYPSQYPMHHGNQLYGQYPQHNVHPTASPNGIPFQSADALTYEKSSSAVAVHGEVTISLKSEQPGE